MMFGKTNKRDKALDDRVSLLEMNARDERGGAIVCGSYFITSRPGMWSHLYTIAGLYDCGVYTVRSRDSLSAEYTLETQDLDLMRAVIKDDGRRREEHEAHKKRKESREKKGKK